MKKRLVVTVVAGMVALVSATGGAFATVLTFDDLPAMSYIPSGYGGFNWFNFGLVEAPAFSANGPSGYVNGVVSMPDLAYNMLGNDGVISDSSFDFNSAYLTAAWNNGLQIEIKGI